MSPFDPTCFRAEAVPAQTRALNEALAETVVLVPDWWVVGAPAARELRRSGHGVFPALPRSERARTVEIDAGGRPIALRVLAPARPRGVYLHIHGGGWVLGGADLQDARLEHIVAATGLAVASVEYRLAPEHPYPAAPDDCEAAALWLIANGRAQLGGEHLVIGGESAGAHLAVVTLLRLRDRHGYTGCRGANLVFGCFDLSMTPSQRAFGDPPTTLRTSDIEHYLDAFVPAGIDRRDPDVSPLYARLDGLPPALFTVGTYDALLDDSLFLYARWIAAGNPAELDVHPGAPHGFTAFMGPAASAANGRAEAFLARACPA